MTPNGSTGPRSAEGKAASSQNALKTGIYANATLLPGEDPEERRLLIEEYYRRWTPTTPEQRVFADILVNAEWMLRRLRRCEEQIWALYQNDDWYSTPEINVGMSFFHAEPTMARLQQRISSFERSYKSALHEIQRLKKEEAGQEAGRAAAQAGADQIAQLPAPPDAPAQPSEPTPKPDLPLTASSFRQTVPAVLPIGPNTSGTDSASIVTAQYSAASLPLAGIHR